MTRKPTGRSRGRPRSTGNLTCDRCGAATAQIRVIWPDGRICGVCFHHATRTVGDFRDLRALEDRASTYAIAGDVFVIAGLVSGGLGGYLLYRDHRRHVTIAPAPARGGMMLAVTGGL